MFFGGEGRKGGFFSLVNNLQLFLLDFLNPSSLANEQKKSITKKKNISNISLH